MSDANTGGRPVPGDDYPISPDDWELVAECNGLCFRASDVGVDVPGDPVAYPNLLCPRHWGSEGS